MQREELWPLQASLLADMRRTSCSHQPLGLLQPVDACNGTADLHRAVLLPGCWCAACFPSCSGLPGSAPVLRSKVNKVGQHTVGLHCPCQGNAQKVRFQTGMHHQARCSACSFSCPTTLANYLRRAATPRLTATSQTQLTNLAGLTAWRLVLVLRLAVFEWGPCTLWAAPQCAGGTP